MNARGFTLIELVVAVAIVAVLASAALPLNELVVQRAKEQDLRRALREIRTAIDAYKQASDDGRIPEARRRIGLSRSGSRTWWRASRTRRTRRRKTSTSCAGSRAIRLPPTAPLPTPPPGARRSYASPPDDPREGEDVFDVYTARAPARASTGGPTGMVE